MRVGGGRRSASLYRTVMFLLPPSFRRQYGELMVDAFNELARDQRVDRRSALGCWWLVGCDFFRTFGREWGTELGMKALWDLCLRVLGLAAIAGSAGWFVLFIGPEWEPMGDLGWGQNGLGYRPRAIVVASALLALGLVGAISQERSRWSRLRTSGMWLLVASVVLIAVQAPVPMGGTSFAATPADGVGVYLLPLAIAAMVVDWSRRSGGRAVLVLLRRMMAIAVSIAAVGLLLPLDAYWYDMWDFVLRHAFIFPVLWIALSFGYRLVGGPRVEVRVTRAARTEVAQGA